MNDSQQESLEEGRELIAALIGDGRLDQAAFRARRLVELSGGDPGCIADSTLTEWLLDVDLPKDRPEAWRAAFGDDAIRAPAISATIGGAVRRHLVRGLARAVEGPEGRGALLGGEPVGVFLLAAGLAEEAAASLYATVARMPGNGRAALLLGNALLRLERVEEARDAYRRAFRIAPLELDGAEIDDEEVRDLLPLSVELELPGDPRPWLPVIGLLEDVLPFSALDPVPGAGFGAPTRAYDLLIAHKGARSHGERTAIRRDLRELAPALFDALLLSRKLDATPAPTGTA